MAANYGFIYVLRNICMPGIYKIGMTDRAPSQRAEELSAATSVPTPFDLVCFAEVRDAFSVEKEMHTRFSDFRVSSSREFFALAGDDFRDVFAFLEESGAMVAYGDLSFIEDSKCFGPIGRARAALTSAGPVRTWPPMGAPSQ